MNGEIDMIDAIIRLASNLVQVFFSKVSQMDMTHWSIVGVLLVVVGAFCMRGFGSIKKH
ncbi:MAG: hypothetical protein O2931_00870 [Planctomycetota bacterium]|nr:hypothetical protein [Planctomycetota bacterium]